MQAFDSGHHTGSPTGVPGVSDSDRSGNMLQTGVGL